MSVFVDFSISDVEVFEQENKKEGEGDLSGIKGIAHPPAGFLLGVG